MNRTPIRHAPLTIALFTLVLMTGCGGAEESSTVPPKSGPANVTAAPVTVLSDGQIEDLVRRSYQYVAMYNVNNKFAQSLGGWNRCRADTELKDHTMREIARPNNDTLYIACMLDLRADALILAAPAFDSRYVSLMVTGYDHYVTVPLTTRRGDFREPAKILFHSARTSGYRADETVTGVDQTFETSGDFVSAIFRVMPHSNDPELFEKIIGQMQSVTLTTLSEFRGGAPKPIDDVRFPTVGRTDFDVFGGNLLEVMQFVFNHTTFDANNELDQAVLAAYAPLGVAPGRQYDPDAVAELDAGRIRSMAEKVAAENLAIMGQPEVAAKLNPYWMEPKGRTSLDALLAASVIGPIGLPSEEAEYPPIVTSDRQPMNAMHDYVIRMTSEQLPPAKAFWSVTLYDMKNGFFIPNERRKYSVGENAGMELGEDGGIEIYIAAEKPDGVPDENWLPIVRRDEDLSINLRIYVPDRERMKAWRPPVAEKLR